MVDDVKIGDLQRAEIVGTEEPGPRRGGVAIALRGERDVAAVRLIHAVLLHRACDDLRAPGGERRDGIVGAQPQMDAVGWRGAAAARGSVPWVAGPA